MDANQIAQFLTSADAKFYAVLLSGSWIAFRALNWVKDFREKDVKGIKDDLGAQTGVIHAGFTTLSSNLQELRSDFRTFYTSPDPLMIPANARTTRKRKSVAERNQAKARRPAAKKAPKAAKAAK